MQKTDCVRIHVITYRRVHLLKRALNSILEQTHQNWVAEVINDDPTDGSVEELIQSFNDPRIFLSQPMIKRGGTENFNYCFRKVDEPFACILEDDNWFEPTFLSTMLSALGNHTSIEMAVGNELIWKELPDNQWINTHRTIWEETAGTSIFSYHLFDKCGRAKICNSSMVWRTENAHKWKTPEEIPIDVTEHFRERIIPHPLLLVHTPLVNFAETIQTFRNKTSDLWSVYQTLLIASIFTLVDPADKKNLADKLWGEARINNKLFSTTLLNSAFAHKSARILLYKAKPLELLRYLLTALKRPATILNCINAIKQQQKPWNFLLQNNNTRKKICIVTQSHLSRNPRVVKEAIALAKANYQVVIITSIFSEQLYIQDLTLIANYTIEIKLISKLNESTFISFTDRLKRKIGTLINQHLRIENKFTLGYGINRYIDLCSKEKANLYICHQELATYVGNKLIKKGFNVAFDFEDWYAEDLLPSARKSRPINLLKKNEQNALHSGLFSYTTSQSLANQLALRYRCKTPMVIYNVFPSPQIPINHRINLTTPIKLFWFSQFIGAGRGLEEFITILNQFKKSVELHLLGDINLDFKHKLTDSLAPQHVIHFHSLVEPDKLAEKIAFFDVGLALEKTDPLSRNLTITNKFFQYLQSGLPIIASQTDGQVEVFNKNNPGFLIKNNANASDLLELENWLYNEEALNSAKEKAIALAGIYNWENEEKKLIALVNQYIS